MVEAKIFLVRHGETEWNVARRIQGACRLMGLLIEDLLKLSSVTRRELTRQSVDLSSLAAEIVDNLRRAEALHQAVLYLPVTAEGAKARAVAGA